MERTEAYDEKRKLLYECIERLDASAQSGDLTGSNTVVQKFYMTAGPRAGAIEMNAGTANGAILRAMSANECALARHILPTGWKFNRSPQVYMNGRCVRLEAEWPDNLADTDIKLSDLSQYPLDSNSWVCGKSETGATVVASIDDDSPHILIAGTTGSGKTVSIRSTAIQLSSRRKDRNNSIILIDGKRGDGLRGLDALPGVVGPIASSPDDIRSAMNYAVSKMNERYDMQPTDRDLLDRIVILFDEVQEAMDDEYVKTAIEKLAQQGRAAGVHLVIGTQHPTNGNLKSPVLKRCIPTRFALRVTDFEASKSVVGQASPRADWLSGKGDAYIVNSQGSHRCQMAYVPKSDEINALTSKPTIDSWPKVDGETIAGEFTKTELACSIISAYEEEGRPSLVRRLKSSGSLMTEGDRAKSLLHLGKEVYNELETLGYWLVSTEDTGLE